MARPETSPVIHVKIMNARGGPCPANRQARLGRSGSALPRLPRARLAIARSQRGQRKPTLRPGLIRRTDGAQNGLLGPQLSWPRAERAGLPFATEGCSPYCAGAGVTGAGASGAGGVSVIGASPPDLPSTQLIKVASYLQPCLWACTTTKTAAITIKIRRIRIQAPSLLRRRKVYEWTANKKARCEAATGFHGVVIWPLQPRRGPNKAGFCLGLSRSPPPAPSRKEERPVSRNRGNDASRRARTGKSGPGNTGRFQ